MFRDGFYHGLLGAVALAAMVVIMASLAASLIPALQAARVDPAVALRQE
jgi:ABC-type lipoprotein release transport system permease subunit